MTAEQWARVERLYHEANAHPPDQREGWLDRMCPDDPLVRQEVASLLAQDVSTSGLLDGRALAGTYVAPASDLSGRQLAGYKFLSLVDEGGMGQVYRARDVALPRDVAVKVIAPEFASDPARRARFRREADVLAAFAHPHIAHIYAFIEAEGHSLLAMELVPGETLAERIARGPMDVREALYVARQIADALDAAHEAGVIHRDLKPANVRITPDRVVKVLDFGLATSARSALRADSTNGTHIAKTAPGTLLGTVAYMSPEQARGESVDKRTDIWAFGCVLYEMLSGRRPFEGATPTDTLAAIVQGDVDWTGLPASVPVVVRELLARCLNKDRKARLRDIGEACIAVDSMLRFPLDPPVAASAGHTRRIAAVPAISLLVAGAAGASLAVLSMVLIPRSTVGDVTESAIVFTDDAALTFDAFELDFAITPDGRSIVYVGNNGTRLYVRPLGSLEPRLLVSSGTPHGPFISPDGQWVGFWDSSQLKKVSLTGGAPIVIGRDINGPRGATWVSDGTIIYGTFVTGLFSISEQGGSPKPLTILAEQETAHTWPEALPGGRKILFTTEPKDGGSIQPQIAVFDRAVGGTPKVLVDGGMHAHYTVGGHLLYSSAEELRAVRFDVDTLTPSGSAVTALPRLFGPSGGQYALASNGTLIYLDSPELPERSLVWVDRNQKEEPILLPPNRYVHPRLSPDDHKIAVYTYEMRQGDVLIVDDLQALRLRNLTQSPSYDGFPAWTLDGRFILFNSPRARERVGNIWRQAVADGTQAAERFGVSDHWQGEPDVSPDGSVIFAESAQRDQTFSTKLMIQGVRDKPGSAVRLLNTSFSESNPAVSPDARWLAFQSNRQGRDRVFVRPYPNVKAAEWFVSDGTRPRFARGKSARELLFVGVDGALMHVDYGASPPGDWKADSAQKVLDAHYFTGIGDEGAAVGAQYDMSLDGKRFLMIKPAAISASGVHLTLVEHFDQKLMKLFADR